MADMIEINFIYIIIIKESYCGGKWKLPAKVAQNNYLDSVLVSGESSYKYQKFQVNCDFLMKTLQFRASLEQRARIRACLSKWSPNLLLLASRVP